ncbi:glycoside hydrolase family 130 protein [Phycisphaeraceae bacterium D3-23]
MAKLINTPALPHMPWEDRPAGCAGPIWRYTNNPIVSRDDKPGCNSIFNSAAIAFDGRDDTRFAGVFRCDTRELRMKLHAGFSADGLKWDIKPEPIDWIVPEGVDPVGECYDPRVVKIDNWYYIIWCNCWHGPTVGLGYTDDFKTFHLIENATLPYNRNGVLFPRKFPAKDGAGGDDYLLLSRPCDAGHSAMGDIFLSRSKDLIHWGRHKYVMGREQPWESTKVGAGPAPIETDAGWLLIYHGVLTTCNGYVYRIGAALLDRDEPWKVVARAKPYLMGPWEDYECVGDVPNVTFPCAALADGDTGRIAIYYGCADTVTGIAFCEVGALVDWIKANA